jgi:hypothetical protein
MKPLSLLLLGVVVGWAASGVDWSRDAVAQEENVDTFTDRVPTPGVFQAQPQSDKSLIADEPPQPAWNNGGSDQTAVTRPAPAGPSLAPGLVGRYQATAYGSPNGHGCYIVDTMTGKTWHVANGQLQPHVATEALGVQPMPGQVSPQSGWLTPDLPE